MEKGILREKYRGAVRRVFLAVFFFAAMFLLSACGNAGSGVPEDSSDMAEAEEPGLAVLLVTDSKIAEDSIEDRTRNGIENFLKKHPSCTLEEIVETDARKAVPRASGYDAAVFVGASFSGIGEAAGEQRDSRFIVIDTTVADAEGEVLFLRLGELALPDFIQKIIDTRNYYTHYDASKLVRSFSEEELFFVNAELLALLQFHVLRLLGFDRKMLRERVIKAVMLNNMMREADLEEAEEDDTDT